MKNQNIVQNFQSIPTHRIYMQNINHVVGIEYQ